MLSYTTLGTQAKAQGSASCCGTGLSLKKPFAPPLLWQGFLYVIPVELVQTSNGFESILIWLSELAKNQKLEI